MGFDFIIPKIFTVAALTIKQEHGKMCSMHRVTLIHYINYYVNLSQFCIV